MWSCGRAVFAGAATATALNRLFEPNCIRLLIGLEIIINSITADPPGLGIVFLNKFFMKTLPALRELPS